LNVARQPAREVEKAAADGPGRYAGAIRCPALDRAGAPPCPEKFDVSFDAGAGVYRGICPKHSDIAVCEGGVLDGLKVKKE
jgi:hypothetical protein